MPVNNVGRCDDSRLTSHGRPAAGLGLGEEHQTLTPWARWRNSSLTAGLALVSSEYEAT